MVKADSLRSSRCWQHISMANMFSGNLEMKVFNSTKLSNKPRNAYLQSLAQVGIPESHSLTTSRTVSAGLENSLVPENWDFYLLSKRIYFQLPFRISQPYRKKNQKVVRTLEYFTSMSVDGNNTMYSVSDITLNICKKQNVLYHVQETKLPE